MININKLLKLYYILFIENYLEIIDKQRHTICRDFIKMESIINFCIINLSFLVSDF